MADRTESHFMVGINLMGIPFSLYMRDMWIGMSTIRMVFVWHEEIFGLTELKWII